MLRTGTHSTDPLKPKSLLYKYMKEGAILFQLQNSHEINRQAIKAEKPKAKLPLLDELLQKQQAGTLADYVKEGMSCKQKS